MACCAVMFIWYAVGRFEMYTAGVVLFIGAAFFILLYFIGISVEKGFAVFISVLYFLFRFSFFLWKIFEEHC